MNHCEPIAGFIRVVHRSIRWTFGSGRNFCGFRRSGHDFVDMYVYGNYFALILFVHDNYFEQVVTAQIFFNIP